MHQPMEEHEPLFPDTGPAARRRGVQHGVRGAAGGRRHHVRLERIILRRHVARTSFFEKFSASLMTVIAFFLRPLFLCVLVVSSFLSPAPGATHAGFPNTRNAITWCPHLAMKPDSDQESALAAGRRARMQPSRHNRWGRRGFAHHQAPEGSRRRRTSCCRRC